MLWCNVPLVYLTAAKIFHRPSVHLLGEGGVEDQWFSVVHVFSVT